MRVVQHGTLTAAAEALGVQTSSVSRDLTSLEEDLGARLLHRTTRRIVLTEAGRVYYERARAAMRDLEEAGSLVNEMIHEPRGPVRVSVHVDVASAALGSVVARFLERYPAITVDLRFGRDPGDRDVDLALSHVRDPDSTRVARRIATIELGAFVSADYAARRGAPETPDELAAHACIQVRIGGTPFPWRFAGPWGKKEVATSGSLTVDGFRLVHSAVCAGAGIGLVPVNMVEATPSFPLVRLLPGHAIEGAALYAVSLARQDLPVRAALFRDFLLAELAAEGPPVESHPAGGPRLHLNT